MITATIIVAGFIVGAVIAFATYCIGFWRGERAAAINYRRATSIINGTHVSRNPTLTGHDHIF
jgi:hypothetical protein